MKSKTRSRGASTEVVSEIGPTGRPILVAETLDFP
jgi:hypothetical protein